MISTRLDKELVLTVIVKLEPLYSKIKPSLCQSCTLGTLLPKLPCGESKESTCFNSHYTA